MRIASLASTPYCIPFGRPFATAYGIQTERSGFLLQLHTDNGLVGLGEAAPIPGSGPRAWSDTAPLLEYVQASLPGKRLEEATDLIRLVDHLHPAAVGAVRCGLDVAVCDVLAQTAGLPVASWLQGDSSETVPANATIALPDAASAADAAAKAGAAGFPCVKLKVGMAAAADVECERVAAVRKAIGKRLKLRLDANGAWGVEQAIYMIRTLEPYDIELVEQPVASGNVKDLGRVRAAVRTPIAADEDVDSVAAAERVLETGAAQVLVIKPMVVGGLRPARRIIEHAQSHGVSCIVTTTLDAGIGTAAALHLAATLPSPSLACGLATGALLATDLLTAPLTVRDGRMHRPSAVGLGVRLNGEALEHYRRAL